MAQPVEGVGEVSNLSKSNAYGEIAKVEIQRLEVEVAVK